MNPKLIAFLVLAGLMALFILQNIQTVTVQFLFWSFSTSRALMLIIVFVIGLLSGWILASRKH